MTIPQRKQKKGIVAHHRKETAVTNPHDILKYPVATEKAIRMMESENKLIFIVHKKASKNQIKQSIQQLFKANVLTVNTTITPQGEKQAYIKLSKNTPAIDIATNLGIM
ncbi:MAG: 50S ribosomal protein L23 [Candidatus Woesearchaeota archaeon]|nr:50S ribosomal protein L23 [Candidatus Woesearchaeota archaeon]